MTLIKWTKTYPKDAMKVAGVVILGLLAVSADGFSDYAKTKFWWSFWGIVQILAVVGWVVGYALVSRYVKKKESQK